MSHLLCACCTGQRWASQSEVCRHRHKSTESQRDNASHSCTRQFIHHAIRGNCENAAFFAASHTQCCSLVVFSLNLRLFLKCSFSDSGIHTGVLFNHRVFWRSSVCCKANKCLGKKYNCVQFFREECLFLVLISLLNPSCAWGLHASQDIILKIYIGQPTIKRLAIASNFIL